MNKYFFLAACVLFAPLVSPAQDVGTAADVSSFSLQLSYEHLSRDFSLAGARQEIGRDIYKATVGFRPTDYVYLYGFFGSSDFPNSYIQDGRHLYYGAGLKYMMVGEVDITEQDGRDINVRGGIGLDFQVARLQSSKNEEYEKFGLTKYQGSLDFGLRIFQFAGYFGFKFSKISGTFQPLVLDREIEAKGKGLFSMMLGFNWHLSRHLALVSEFSFFTESSWALGLRLDL
ncbi:MAG: hypothetical protein NTV82_11975 [Candidatus Aminicenantes bacterium]|nr:hypothetical protein [Candidatus Aminicenantes bacterium]